MSAILIHDVDEAVVGRLQARALGNGRSLHDELKLIREQAARPDATRLPRSDYRRRADQIRVGLADRPQSDSTELLAEDRGR